MLKIAKKYLDSLIDKLCQALLRRFNLDLLDDPAIEELGAQAADEMLDIETEVDKSDARLFNKKCRYLPSDLSIFAGEYSWIAHQLQV